KQGFDLMLVTRRVAQLLVQMDERNSYVFGQVFWVGFKHRVIQYERLPRPFGRSRWTIRRKVEYFIDAFTAFSSLPLRLSSTIGICLAIVGLVYAAVLALTSALGKTTGQTDIAALTVVVLVAAGIQMFMIGICGEYLWRVLEESRRRPTFIVADRVNFDVPRRSDGPARLDHPPVSVALTAIDHELTLQ